MTENEAKGFIQGKLDCMNKCDVFDCKGTDECDGCNYCYSQGNFGEQKKALETAIKALEEIQQYRAIGTIDEFKALKEKQIAKKPHHISEIDDNDNAMVECPICHANSDYSVKTITSGYCWKCGQKLDWQ